MSDFDAIWSAVHKAASQTMPKLVELGSDWEKIKNDPVYGPLVQEAVTAATVALTADGIPIGPLVNIGEAVAKSLDAMAAARSDIKTTPTK